MDCTHSIHVDCLVHASAFRLSILVNYLLQSKSQRHDFSLGIPGAIFSKLIRKILGKKLRKFRKCGPSITNAQIVLDKISIRPVLPLKTTAETPQKGRVAYVIQTSDYMM